MPMVDIAERAGTGMSATAVAQATWAPAVRRVRVFGWEDVSGGWMGTSDLKKLQGSF